MSVFADRSFVFIHAIEGHHQRFLVRDLLRLLIAYLLNTVFSVPVKGGRLYRTQSDYNEMRSGM